MKAKITFYIYNCAECPFHEEHSIVTIDSFDHETGIYCSKVEEPNDYWAQHTYDGFISKKLVISDEWDPRKYANVPSWCPFLTDEP